MINNDLVGYLRLVVAPEAGDIYIDAYRVLTQTGSTAHEFAIEQYLHDADNMDTSTVLAFIEKALVENLEDRLGEQGVQINEHRNNPALSELSAMVEALASIDSYGDPETIYNICMDETENAESKLCQILTFFTPFTIADYIPLIVSVNIDLIHTISDLLRVDAADAMDSEYASELLNLKTPIEEIRERTTAYINERPGLLLSTLLQQSTPLGLSVDVYIELCRDSLVTLSPRAIIPELIALTYASDTPTNEVKSVIIEQIQTLIGDYDAITQANIVLSKEAL